MTGSTANIDVTEDWEGQTGVPEVVELLNWRRSIFHLLILSIHLYTIK